MWEDVGDIVVLYSRCSECVGVDDRLERMGRAVRFISEVAYKYTRQGCTTTDGVTEVRGGWRKGLDMHAKRQAHLIHLIHVGISCLIHIHVPFALHTWKSIS